MMPHGPLTSTREGEERYLGKQHRLLDLCNLVLRSVCQSPTWLSKQTFAKSMAVYIPNSKHGINLSAFTFPSKALQMLPQHCSGTSPKNTIHIGYLLLAILNFFQSGSLKKKCLEGLD